MKTKLGIVVLVCFSWFTVHAQFVPVTNEVDAIFDFSSYDTTPIIEEGAYLATGFANMYPQFTNSIWSGSRSGASLLNQRTNQQPQWYPALWAIAWSNHVVPFDFHLANDNGNFNSNIVYTNLTALGTAPGLLYNGTATTNEGITAQVVTLGLGGNINDVAGGDGGAVSRNAGSMQFNLDNSWNADDLWHDTGTNGWIADQAGARILGFQYGGGHFQPAGGLANFIAHWRAVVGDTNVGSITFNFQGDACTQSNQFAAVGMSHTTTSFGCTLKANRMPPSWDTVPPALGGVISNNVAAPDCFQGIPLYGMALRWMVTVTNFPSDGIWNCYLDGVLVDSANTNDWAHGRNWATNQNSGPFCTQRLLVLNDVYDKYGVDHTNHINTHTAGGPGVHGPDLINYQSGAQGNWPAQHGISMITAMFPTAISMRTNYDVIIHNDAQQVPHTMTLSLQSAAWPAPFR